MRSSVLFCVVLAALFACSLAVDYEIKLHKMEFSSKAPFRCLRKGDGMQTIKLDKLYVSVANLDFEHKERTQFDEPKKYKNSGHCTWQGKSCVWKGGYRIRLRDIHGGKFDTAKNDNLFFNLRRSSKGVIFRGSDAEVDSTPFGFNTIYDHAYGKGRITREFKVQGTYFSTSRCFAPTVKLTFEVIEAPPLKK